MIIKIPHTGFISRTLAWSPAGDSIVIFGKEKCTMAYFTNRENLPPTDKRKAKISKEKEIQMRLKNLNIINA